MKRSQYLPVIDVRIEDPGEGGVEMLQFIQFEHGDTVCGVHRLTNRLKGLADTLQHKTMLAKVFLALQQFLLHLDILVFAGAPGAGAGDRLAEDLPSHPAVKPLRRAADKGMGMIRLKAEIKRPGIGLLDPGQQAQGLQVFQEGQVRPPCQHNLFNLAIVHQAKG